MPEWLVPDSVSTVDPSVTTLAVRLLGAWLAGFAVALIAKQGKPVGDRHKLTLTLILLSILIAMATQIIGDNIARAFSLVGALSIVRFRTAVPATRDVAFVLAAVVVGMAVGAGQYWICALGLPIVALATGLGTQTLGGRRNAASHDPDAAEPGWQVTIQAALNPSGGWEETLAACCEQHELRSASSSRRGSSLEFTFRCVLKPNVPASTLVTELNALPNIQSVSAKQLSADS